MIKKDYRDGRPFPGTTQLVSGLTEDQAQKLLGQHGPNEIAAAESRSLIQIVFAAMREPMFLLLISCSLLYFFLGDINEAIFLLVAVAAVIAITLVQEYRAEKTMEHLRNLSSPRARVLRDGIIKRIAGREVVPGDIVLISEGDRIPVDGVVVSSQSLQVDESLITGESLAVDKTDQFELIGQRENPHAEQVFASTLVVQGRAYILSQKTGMNTAVGKIGRSLSETSRPASPLQINTRSVVYRIAVASIVVSLFLALAMGLRSGNWINGLLTGLAFAMGTIPEEFPVVLTVFMALGAWRISRQRVLTRQPAAIEALGSVTTLCVDKTGTLTENRMRVAEAWTNGETFSLKNDALPQAVSGLLGSAALASHAETFDPMDRALLESANEKPPHTKPERVYPLTKTSRSMAQAWKKTEGSGYTIALKGAPEAVAALSHLTDSEHQKVLSAVTEMSTRGLRVLGVAVAQYHGELPNERNVFDFHFIGLVAFSDPVRAGVAEAVRQCHNAGIKVIMMTGDFPGTAVSVAKEIGLEQPERFMTGEQIAEMDAKNLTVQMREIRVLARMIPQQKLRVVEALRQQGEIVAMTGDGVNDAPALKAAHVGIAMGERGTDVAREAAAIVLLNDDFKSIVSAVNLGRRIYDNIQKAMSYIIAVHVPIVGLAMVPVFSGLPLILLPMHIAFLELIIDPACSIAFEAEPAEVDLMLRKPRATDASLFSWLMLRRSIGIGFVVLIATMGLYLILLHQGKTAEDARASVFATLVFANIGLILAFRSRKKIGFSHLFVNPMLVAVVLFTLAMLAVVLWLTPIRNVFHFEHLHPSDVLICLGTAALSVAAIELAKLVRP